MSGGTASDILLIGYYGRGNFGDDVLMAVAHRGMREALPTSTIAIRLPDDGAYASRLLEDDVTIVAFGERTQHQIIVHGGGGTFFDFTPHGRLDRFMNAAMLSCGPGTYVRAEVAVRALAGRPRVSAKTRIGLGLGIGTYTPGSRRLRDSLPVLLDFKGMWVRDPDSASNLRTLGVKAPVVVGSDLAFLHEYWCPPSTALSSRKAANARPRLGLILRDWPPGGKSTLLLHMTGVVESLARRYELTLVSLDPSTDGQTISALGGYPHILWQPQKMRLDDMATALAEQDVLLTARAHGAICGACVGRPSVILNVEPKLAAVHAMLPRTSKLACPYASSKDLQDMIEEALWIPAADIEADVAENQAKSRKALTSMREFMRQ